MLRDSQMTLYIPSRENESTSQFKFFVKLCHTDQLEVVSS